FHASLTDPGAAQEAYLYEWDFNYNGQSLVVQALGADASHQFIQPGTYQVALRVTDSNGGSGVSVLTVMVNNVPPTADAGPSQAINEGDTASFQGTATDPGAPPETLSYAWDFNYDGQAFVAQASGADATHTFVQPDTYQVALRVTDSNGASSLSMTTVTVTNVAPTPYAGANQTIDEGSTAAFHASLTDPGAAQEAYLYEWDFNYNGQYLVVQALGADASHPFIQPGTYQVALRVTNSTRLFS